MNRDDRQFIIQLVYPLVGFYFIAEDEMLLLVATLIIYFIQMWYWATIIK